MSVVKTWKAFIKAQEILINQFSEPFSIVFKGEDRTGLARFEVQQKDPLSLIFPMLKKSFPGLVPDDVNLKEGYLLFDSNQTPTRSQELDEFANSNFFEVDYRPCFTGQIKFKNDPFKWLKKFGVIREHEPGTLLATLDSIKRIDEILCNQDAFSRSPIIGCILKVRPSKQYLEFVRDVRLSKFLSCYFSPEVFSIQKDKSLVFKNVVLSENASAFIKGCGYLKSSHRISVQLSESSLLKFEGRRKSSKIVYLDELGRGDSEFQSIFPNPKNFAFHFNLGDHASIADVDDKIRIIARLFCKILQSSEFQIAHEQTFEFDVAGDRSYKFEWGHFYTLLQTAIARDTFKLSPEKDTVAFDFSAPEELEERINDLRKIDIADFDFKGVEHAFKVRIEFQSPLFKVQEQLQKIPAVKTKVNHDSLKFFCNFDDQAIHSILVTKIKNAVGVVNNSELDCSFDNLEDSKLRYFVNFKYDEFQNDIDSKFSYLKGEELIIKGEHLGSPIGTIVKVDFPYMLVSVGEDKEIESRNISFVSGEELWVHCQLKGERDKIKRLADAIDIIFKGTKSRLLNENLRSILMDSSTAKSSPGNILLSSDFKETMAEISQNQLSKNINENQKQAIAKSLLASDFFVIQGPPGTGKSTAIAELIWQHVRVNLQGNKPYRVLVTSETNLAVDNALDKLRSDDHVLIKPLRFGSDEKLDREGKRFSLEALRKWTASGSTEDGSEDEVGRNILQDWIGRLVKNAKIRDSTIPNHLIDEWVNCLEEANSVVRGWFFETYLNHANVFGATCSSIGKENSEQRFTRFFSDYCSIVHPKEYETFRNAISKTSIKQLKKIDIEFDLVVQDEASKASPPELALPCLFARKAIVIGDHRQLPPMVDTNEFLENLKRVKAKSREEKNKNEIDQLITFIRKNRGEFAISHFEKLFKNIDANLKASFNVQYRMHPAINETVKQFYIEDGGLECGIPEDLANSSDMSHPLNRFHGVTANKQTHIVWLDVDSPEIVKGTSRVNPGEVKAIDWLLTVFKKSPGYKKFVEFWTPSDIEQKQIGVITFYGAQASALKRMAEAHSEIPLRISPVDRFQGMERNIVIVSLVRSNKIAASENEQSDFERYPETGFPKQDSLGFAEFPNRLNVALSRAKRLLIIVGNSKHFRRHQTYDRVYQTIANHKNGAVKEFSTIEY